MADLKPSNLTNAVIGLRDQMNAAKTTAERVRAKLTSAMHDFRYAGTEAQRDQAQSAMANHMVDLNTVVDSIHQQAELVAHLAEQMPHGSVAATTGAVGSTDAGTGMQGVAGTAEDAETQAAETKTAPISDASETGIVGNKPDEVEPADSKGQ